MRRPGSRAAGYLVAIAGTLLATVLDVRFSASSGIHLMALYLASVALAAWLGGLGPGILATLLAAMAADWIWLQPRGTLWIESAPDAVRVLLFVASGVLISSVIELMRRSERRLQAKSRQLEEEIAARRVAERAALEGKQGLDLAVGVAGIGWWNMDVATGMVVWSDEVFRVLGLPKPEGGMMPVSAWADRVHPDDRGRVMQALDEARRTRGPYTPRHRILQGGTNDVVWIDVNGRYLYDDQGRAVRMLGMMRDVTAQVRFEEDLQESERRFRTLADNVPVMIWMNGLQGAEFVNLEYLRVLGRAMEQVLGTGWVECVHPDDREAYIAAYDRAAEKRALFEAQVRLRCATGEYRTFRSTGVPRFREDGSLLGYVGCSVDITEMARSEEALRSAAGQKDEFLAVLAHELRNPLAPLRNGIFLLQHAAGEPARRDRALVIMQRQVGYLTRMVDDLLDVSRITRGKLELRRERVELTRLIQDAVETVRPLMESFQHEVLLQLPSHPVWLEGDSVRLGQVFSNLLNNAAKYTDPGGRITVLARQEGTTASVSVKDTGQGIPPELLASIFEMFYQTGASSPAAKGLGIGLALVKRLVELHGGAVEARSEGAGAGSEFIIRIPCLPDERRLPPAAADRPDRVDAVPARHRVLVVDDNDDVLGTVKEVVEHLGSECRLARDGVEALAEAERFRPDMVLMDLGMPRMDGLETARRMRCEAWGRDLLLVAVTGWGQAEDRRRTREAGFDHHMVKPVDPAALAGLLMALSGERGEKGAAPS